MVSLVGADFLIIGLAYFFRYMPSFFFSPLGGWLADHCNKKNVLVVVKSLKCAVAFLFFALFYYANASISMLVFAAMLMASLDCVYVPVFRSYFPEVVEKERICSVNSGVQVVEDVASIIGPLVFSLIAVGFLLDLWVRL